MVRRLFSAAAPAKRGDDNRAEHGLWVYGSQIYQVVGLPLTFGADEPGQTPLIDGALIMAVPLSDAIASTLGKSHDCDITFMADGDALSSSLPPAQRSKLSSAYRKTAWPLSKPFNVRLGEADYRSSLEPLSDNCSGEKVAAMLIQSNSAQAFAVQQKVWESLGVILVLGLLAALLMSYLLSGAVTRPVHELVRGAQSVAGGDLNVALRVKRRDELGELAIAFNDMVSGLRRQRQLQALVDESQAASKAKSQFLANMSHEIRTPLHGVIGMSDLLLRTDLSNKQRRYAGLIKSSAQVLTTLINDILDFSKIESGKLELEQIAFDPRSLLEDAVELLSQKAIAKGLTINCLIDPNVPASVCGDPTRLRQILLNLISNAVKFTEKGSVRVHAAMNDQHGEPARLRIEVSDTGIGIPSDRIDRLFKSFSQVDASTTRRYGGTGLGLAICKQLVELMGGELGVTSAPALARPSGS